MKTDKQFIKEAGTVLLAADNKCLLDVCQEFLEVMAGYRTLIAWGWKEALKVYKDILEMAPDHEEAEEAYLKLRFKVLPREGKVIHPSKVSG